MKHQHAANFVLDTDIGSDVDDLMALALLLQAPNVNIEGITTVYGDSVLRSKIVHHVLGQAGRNEIPVIPGADSTLFAFEQPWMAGHEGKNLPSDVANMVVSKGDAAEFLLHKGRDLGKRVDLFAIGPLTNLAHAVLRDIDAMRGYRTIYIMGGVFGFDDPELRMPLIEHNIKCDPEAAKIVFEAGLPIKLISLDVTHSVPLRREDIEAIGALADPLHQFLFKELRTWLEFLENDYTLMHDPLTIAAALWPDLFEYRARNVMVEVIPGRCRGMTLYSGEGTTEIAVRVDAKVFHQRFMECILRTRKGGR